MVESSGNLLDEMCGPISTGGLGDPVKNLALFEKCLLRLKREGFNPFNQIPLQRSIDRLVTEWRRQGGKGYCTPILEVVYKSIFQSGCLRRAFMLPDWNSSIGTSWEHKKLSELGIPISDYPAPLYEECKRLAA
jgi:hypothetical protein